MPHSASAASLPLLWLMPLLMACPSAEGEGLSPAAPVSVFLLAGQSNMEGYGPLLPEMTGDWPGAESLQTAIDEGRASDQLLSERDDVWVHFESPEDVRTPGLLVPGFGSSPDFHGPELSLGHRLGEAWEAPIVLYKAAVGGTTLGRDWLPPSAAARTGGSSGPLYHWMLDSFRDFREGTLEEVLPTAVAERGVRLAGFVWLQGWNDQFEDGFVDAYEENLVDLISDVRHDLASEDLPAFIVEGPTLSAGLRAARQDAIQSLEALQPGRQALVTTEDLVEEEVEGNFHFHFNSSNFLEVGERTAEAILASP